MAGNHRAVRDNLLLLLQTVHQDASYRRVQLRSTKQPAVSTVQHPAARTNRGVCAVLPCSSPLLPHLQSIQARPQLHLPCSHGMGGTGNGCSGATAPSMDCFSRFAVPPPHLTCRTLPALLQILSNSRTSGSLLAIPAADPSSPGDPGRSQNLPISPSPPEPFNHTPVQLRHRAAEY